MKLYTGKISNLEKVLVNLFTFFDHQEYVKDKISDPSFTSRWNKKVDIYRTLLKTVAKKNGYLSPDDTKFYWHTSSCTKLSLVVYYAFRRPIH